MSIPDYQSVMLPLLRQLADRHEHPLPAVIEGLADEFKLTENEDAIFCPAVANSLIIELDGPGRT
jgi:restriction system protein